MRLVEDSHLAQQMLEDLGKEIYIEKGMPHVTELILCLTRGYLDRFHSLLPTSQETLLFACGVGLEKVLLKSHRQHVTGEKDGIFFDTDFLDYDGLPGELKTTRVSAKKAEQWLCVTGMPVKAKSGEVIDMSETWQKQILAYLHCNDATEGTLGVLHLMGSYTPPFPCLKAWHVKASPEEIQGNWEWLLTRRDVYLGFVESRVLPTPHQYNLKWECDYCRYKVVCAAKKAAGET